MTGGFFESITGGIGKMFNAEASATKTISKTLQKLCAELGCEPKDLFVTISALNESFEPTYYVFRKIEGKPTPVRPITLGEILSDDDEDDE
jgi:hypothetical protein